MIPRVDMSQLRLVNRLVNDLAIKSQRVKSVMTSVDRRHFLPSDLSAHAYEDRPLPIGWEQTISAPHMHARALEILQDKINPGSRVLDVGSGSGYLVSCLALLCGPKGYVVGIEKVRELAERSISSIKTANPELGGTGSDPPSISLPGCTLMGKGLNWEIWHGNALYEEAFKDIEGGPGFDAIHVGAAAESIPLSLCKILANGGRMVLPVGRQREAQTLMMVEKDGEGQISTKELMGVIYVPLLGPEEGEGY